MNITLVLANIDGSTTVFHATDIKTTLAFLARHDHEGSSVSFQLDVDDEDLIYPFLDALQKTETPLLANKPPRW